LGWMIAAFLYPVIEHWTWGGGWLAQLGYIDYIGSFGSTLRVECSHLQLRLLSAQELVNSLEITKFDRLDPTKIVEAKRVKKKASKLNYLTPAASIDSLNNFLVTAIRAFCANWSFVVKSKASSGHHLTHLGSPSQRSQILTFLSSGCKVMAP
jgi:hypothetical protein